MSLTTGPHSDRTGVFHEKNQRHGGAGDSVEGQKQGVRVRSVFVSQRCFARCQGEPERLVVRKWGLSGRRVGLAAGVRGDYTVSQLEVLAQFYLLRRVVSSELCVFGFLRQ